MTLSVSFIAKVSAQGDFVCEGSKGFGVDIEAGVFAPADKGVRAHVSFDSANPALLEAFLRLLSGLQPSLVGAMPPALGHGGAK